jgi:hypothetical protein
MSLVLSEKGEIEEAEKILKSVNDSPSFAKKSGYYSTLGHVKLERLFQVFQSSPILAIFCESALYLPLFDSWKSFSDIKTSKSTGISAIGKAAKQILKILIDAFSHHLKFGSAHELAQVGHDIAAVLFSIGFIVDGSSVPIECAYYLDV